VIPVTIVSAAAVAGLGDNLDAIWQGLMNGTCAICPVDRFDTRRYTAGIAAMVPQLADRKDEGSLQALLDLAFKDFEAVPPDARLLTATTKGAIDQLEQKMRGRPARPDEMLPGFILNCIGRRFGLADSGININAACASSTLAVSRAASLIAHETAQTVLVCCADLLSEFVFAGFSALHALSDTPCRPFDRNRNGLTLGEGAAALLLMSAERAEREGRKNLGSVVGWGAANDANHISAPDREGSGLIMAVEQALKQASLPAEAVSAISAHGTGTVYNDLMELKAFAKVFGKRSLPVHSVKGAIGHTLGAAGGIEIALGLRSLNLQVIPPTVGFRLPETGAEARVSHHAQPISGDYLLSTNSGFGGINGAILLKRANQK
jgi:3-oxoacyl-[acyl-carrier-protein] synthase II